MTIILGVDPGSRITGYGVIDFDGHQLKHLDYGCIHTGDVSFPLRLKAIYDELNSVIIRHAPTVCALEEVFVHRNVNSALKLGHARGTAMVVAANHGLSVTEYSPREIKQAVVGYGAAEKTQVQQMVRMLLRLDSLPPLDASDALAIAICQAHTSQGVRVVRNRRNTRKHPSFINAKGGTQ